MLSGVFLIDKEQGISSAQAVSRLKKRLALDRVGHCGTLDPLATGLLVCVCGAATRLASCAESGTKIYSGVIRFGLTTDTDDILGNVLARFDKIPDIDLIREQAKSFTGSISQIPPQISAVKVKGERSYRLARRGQEVKLEPRLVSVKSFELLDLAPGLARFSISCSKGTYIRAIARDLGQALGCGASLQELRREASEPFHVAQARQVDEITIENMLPAASLFPRSLRLTVEGRRVAELTNGNIHAIKVLGLEAEKLGEKSAALCLQQGSDQPFGVLLKGEKGWGFKSA